MTLYIGLALLILVINVVPAFMPPTWIILAFFYSHYHLNIIPTVLVGASAATLGRIILAKLARTHLRKFIPKKYLKNYDHLGKFFDTHQHFTIPVMLTYAFFPIPSNQVYIFAGITKLRLKIIATSFFIGRLISYSFWVKVSYHFSNYLKDIFLNQISKSNTLIAEGLGFGIIILLGFVNWRKILRVK